MIGEIKLKCRKKNISNRRELLPVVLAKMLSRCSVRIHGCTGSPADYPNTMLSWRVLGKLSWFYSLRGRSCSAQFWPRWLSCPLFLWVGRSPSQSLAGHPFRHSCSISQLFCQRLWGMFKGTASEEEKPSSTLNDMAWICPTKIFLGTVWQRTWEVASTYSPSCLLRPTELTPPEPKKTSTSLTQGSHSVQAVISRAGWLRTAHLLFLFSSSHASYPTQADFPLWSRQWYLS